MTGLAQYLGLRRSLRRLRGVNNSRGQTAAPFIATPLSIPTTNLKTLISAKRPVGYSGNFADLARSDGATMTVGYDATTNLPPYALIDAWAAQSTGAAGPATVSKYYDASGLGNHWLSPGVASNPPFSPLNMVNGVRTISFDSWKAGATPKNLRVVLDTPLDRLNMSVYQMVQPVNSTDGNTYFQGFSDTGFATTSALLYCVIGSLALNYGTFRTWTKYPRSHMQTISLSSSASRMAVRIDGSEKADFIVDAAGSVASMQIGKNSTGGNYNAAQEMLCMAVYSVAHDSATQTTVETALNTSFPVKRSGWTNRVIVGTNSLRVGYAASYNQNSSRQYGWGSEGSDKADCEFYNMAVGGRTVASEYSNRVWETSLYSGSAQFCTYFIGDPTNDLAPGSGIGSFASAAIAQAWASDFFGTTTGACAALGGPATAPIMMPFIAALKALGSNVRVVVVTTIGRGGFNTTTNFLQTALLAQNALVRSQAATLGYTVSDNYGDARLQDPTNLAYFAPDQIHEINPGYTISGSIETSALRQSMAA